MVLLRWLACASLVVMAGCPGRPTPRPAVAPVLVPDAAPTFADVEAALAAASAWRADVTIEATGSFTAALEATVIATADNRVRIEAHGQFQGQPIDLLWKSDGQRTTTGVDTPAHTSQAVAIGLTRMGLLHNLAVLIGGGPAPDHAAGGAGDWVQVADPHPTGPGALGFGLRVDGEAVADVTLGVAAGPDGPVMTARTIAVHFEGGDMTVRETYRFDLAYELPSDSFFVGGGP